MKHLSSAWRWLVDWFERGDLVPLLVLVSAYHYAAVLSGKDALPVAIAIGLLVDLGHYRTIRAAVRYNGDWKQAAARWGIAFGMTALSLNYHQRYYGDWWLSAPLPLLIAALAWLQHVDRKPSQKASEPKQEAQAIAKPLAAPLVESNRERVIRLYHERPTLTQAQIAQEVGISRQRVGQYLQSNSKVR